MSSDREELYEILRDILGDFEKGVWVRSCESDDNPAWAMKMILPLKTLARAKEAVEAFYGAK